jgi:hypothetical protein
VTPSADQPLVQRFVPRSLSVVVPVYDEEANVTPLAEGIVAAVRPLGIPFELLMVDDGSRDGTVAALRALVPRIPELVVVRLRRNFGQTAALQAGFDRARGEAVVTLDGDLQNDPRDIPRLLEALADADVVSGWRRRRQDDVLLRKIPSRLANALIRRLTRVPVHDQGCSLKAYRRDVVECLSLYSDMHRFVTVLTMPAAARITEIEVLHHPRRAGHSKYGLSRVGKVLADLLTIQMVTRFQQRPLRGFVALGMPFLLGALLCAAVLPFTEESFVVLETVATLLGLSFLWCVLAGILGQAIVETAARPAGRRLVVREWSGP